MEVKSGDKAKCDNCGYEGVVYGVLMGWKVSHPFCSNCQKNDKLTKLKERKTK